MGDVAKIGDDIWGGTDMDSSVVVSCTKEVTTEMCNLLSQGLPVPLACDLIGLHIDLYQDWVTRGMAGEAPFNKFLVCTKKAIAMNVYTLTVDASDPANENWRRSLEMLKSTRADYFGGASAKQNTFEPIQEEYL